MGYNFNPLESIRAAMAVLSCSPMDFCFDFMTLRKLSATTDAFLWPSDAACFLNFSVAVVYTVNGTLTSLLILDESEKSAQYLQYTPSSDGE